VQTAAAAAQAVIPYKAVRATRGKYLRAEPVAALYEQERVHHVGMFALLEDQQCEWQPGQKSPDRLDALVWSLTELLLPDDEDLPAAGPPIILAGHRR
jgi:phage terminase large subunit-like protein